MADVTLTDNSDDVLSSKNEAVQRALKAIGMTAEKYAKQETPVDTGRLRNSITNAVEDDAAYIGTNVEYAPYVEYGTVHNKAHHMLQKAATEHGEEYKAIMQKALEETSD